jgi:ferredoxin
MKIHIEDYCIRCGLCEDLYPQLFKLTVEDDRIDLRYEGEIPQEFAETARSAVQDCAIAAMKLR